MFGGILHRMILKELLKVFTLSLLSLTGILLMAGIVAEASQQGLGPGQILSIIPLLIPSTLPYTIPATTLFATCVVYGRLAADNEILAIRSSGISLTKVVAPGLILGAAMSVVTMGLYYYVIPHTHSMMREMFLNDAEELLYAMLKRHSQISNPQLPYSIYVQGVQGRRLINPTFKRRDDNGKTDVVTQAREAELRVDRKRNVVVVRMFNGTIWSEGGGRALFDDKEWEVPLPDDVLKPYLKRPRDMTWGEMFEQRRILEDQIREKETEIRRNEELIGLAHVFNDLPLHVAHLKRQVKAMRSQVLSIDAELQMRPALSLGCLFFVLVGCPVGIWFSKSDYLSSFITCFLPIVFVYYPLILCGTGMAKDGQFNPYVTVWAADVVIGLIGLGLFRRLLRN